MCLLQGGEKKVLREEGGVYRPSLEPRQKWPEPFAQNWASRSVGRRTKLLFWRADFHSCRARCPPRRQSHDRHHATHKLHVQMIAGSSCSLSLSSLSLHQGRRCQGVHQNSDFKRSCDSRGGYRLMRQSPSLVGTRGVHHGEGAILCPV